jgi:hypothetical protein
MKVCAECGIEIATRDGDNLCRECEDGTRKAKRKAKRRERDLLMRSLGLNKVKGAMGGTYYE